jgi:hypothetical protein
VVLFSHQLNAEIVPANMSQPFFFHFKFLFTELSLYTSYLILRYITSADEAASLNCLRINQLTSLVAARKANVMMRSVERCLKKSIFQNWKHFLTETHVSYPSHQVGTLFYKYPLGS